MVLIGDNMKNKSVRIYSVTVNNMNISINKLLLAD